MALARALVGSPSLLLLDEPFTGLDRTGARALAAAMERARDQGNLVLVATHDLDAIAELCHHIVILARGKVVLDVSQAAPFTLAELREHYARAVDS